MKTVLRVCLLLPRITLSPEKFYFLSRQKHIFQSSENYSSFIAKSDKQMLRKVKKQLRQLYAVGIKLWMEHGPAEH